MTGGISHDSLLFQQRTKFNILRHRLRGSDRISASRRRTKPGSGPGPDSETVRIPDSHLVPAVVLRLEKLVGRSRSCAEDQSGRNESNSRKINRHSPYLSITLHKCYPYYLFGISTFPNSAYHSIALRKFSITIV